MSAVRIGMAGLDASHVPAFAELLHSTEHPFHIPGARIIAALPGGSPDFELSISLVEKFSTELRDCYDVKIVNSIDNLRAESDMIFLESIDGRVHLE